MLRSTDRILTTHVGSLPRPADLLAMVQARLRGEPVDDGAFDQRVKTAVSEIVRQQVEAGIDIVNDGELSKPSFNTYVADRLAGYEARPNPAAGGFPFADWQDFPGWAASAPLRNAALVDRPVCVGELGRRRLAYGPQRQPGAAAADRTHGHRAGREGGVRGLLGGAQHVAFASDAYPFALGTAIGDAGRNEASALVTRPSAARRRAAVAQAPSR